MIKVFKPKDMLYIKCYAEVAYIAMAWMPELRTSSEEYMCILYSDEEQRALELACINKGTSNSVEFNLIQAIERGYKLGAKSIALIHNHPHSKGIAPTPSIEDVLVTRRATILAHEWLITVNASLILGSTIACNVDPFNTFELLSNKSVTIQDIAKNYSSCTKPFIPDYILIDDTPKNFLEKVKHSWGRLESKIEKEAKPMEFSPTCKIYKSIIDMPKYKNIPKK